MTRRSRSGLALILAGALLSSPAARAEAGRAEGARSASFWVTVALWSAWMRGVGVEVRVTIRDPKGNDLAYGGGETDEQGKIKIEFTGLDLSGGGKVVAYAGPCRPGMLCGKASEEFKGGEGAVKLAITLRPLTAAEDAEERKSPGKG